MSGQLLLVISIARIVILSVFNLASIGYNNNNNNIWR